MTTTTPNNDAGKDMSLALNFVEQYNASPAKADEIVLGRYLYTDENTRSLRVCQFIFLAVLRNKPLIERAIGLFAKKKPRAKLQALLECATAELLEGSKDNAPKIIHFWVETAKGIFSKNEAAFCNAVLRKICVYLLDFRNNAQTFEDKTLLLGHPLWLAERWKNILGEEKALEIMAQNQKPAGVWFRKAFGKGADGAFGKLAEYFEAEADGGFFKMKSGSWEAVKGLVENRLAYIQDPSTARAPKMLSPKYGEKILDLCAAPGGKSRFILDEIKRKACEDDTDASMNSLLVSVDTGKKRLKRLGENLEAESEVGRAIVDCRLLKEDLREKLAEKGLPELFDAVLLDAPCSNSGVLGRRPDARFRITPEDVSACARFQLPLLNEAAKFLKPDGRLVYSTCSIDPEENAQVIAAFLEANKNFTLVEGGVTLPTENADGMGAFLLKKP